MKKIIFIVILFIAAKLITGQNIIYVDCTNSGYENGTFQYPWNTIQEGINDVEANDDPSEIIVAEGEYVENIIVNPDGGNPRPIIRISSSNGNPDLCIIAADDFGINGEVVFFDGHNYETQLIFEGFTITHTNEESMNGLYIAEQMVSLRKCIIRDNTLYGIYQASGIAQEILNCDILMNNSFGIFNGQNSIFSNCIIFSNNSSGNQFGGNMNNSSVTYSCIQNGYNGTGNINSDPLFVDAQNNNYELKWTSTEKSPCIDAGDPDPQYNDPDGTRADMGAFYKEHELNNYSFPQGWTWLCFDILDITDLPTPNQIQNLLDEIKLNINTFYYQGGTIIYSGGSWSSPTYEITSPQGYKIWMNSADETTVSGFRCPADTQFDLDAGENWIGYYLEDTQLVYDAFDGYLDDISVIKAQSWGIKKDNGVWPPSVAAYTLSPGDMVIVTCERNINSFAWSSADRSRTEPFIIPQPILYDFTEEKDYIPIFVELDENDLPDEIAVFVDDECVGARVVQFDFENICAYITELQGGNVEIEFGYYERSAKQRFSRYTVYDNATGYRETTAINLKNKQDYYYVSFRGSDDNPVNVPVEFTISNYPNPFNPKTTISYNLPSEGKIELAIYNLKGQKVKELVNGVQSSGEYTIDWNGKDDAGKPVSSGIYYYRISVCGKKLNKKMIMLK